MVELIVSYTNIIIYIKCFLITIIIVKFHIKKNKTKTMKNIKLY